ncbi:MAG: hypothetical protein IPP51_06455 [Bacteroidetes bacterium]|nr:hypothetical protein [Bacteroidota bacterium]
MKKLQILLVLLLLTATAFSQQHGRRPQMSSQERAEKRAETMKAKLNLTDAQYQTIYSQFLKTEQQIDQQREIMRKVREENDQVLKSTLSPEQYSQYKDMQEQRRKMNRERNQNGQTDDPAPIEDPVIK